MECSFSKKFHRRNRRAVFRLLILPTDMNVRGYDQNPDRFIINRVYKLMGVYITRGASLKILFMCQFKVDIL